jgi:hypothetical protein
VLSLRLAGIGAEGTTCSLPEDHVARRITEESLYWLCDAIVLGTRRLHGIGRLSARGVRERILRMSPLPVIAAPTPADNGIYRCSGFLAPADDEHTLWNYSGDGSRGQRFICQGARRHRSLSLAARAMQRRRVAFALDVRIPRPHP